MNPEHIQFPLLGAKWWIGVTALTHTAVASLAIGFAFLVTVAQVVGYRRRERGYDLLAKRIQLLHVCIYNIGTVLAVGLIFGLSGLFPQFWSQIFVHQFWTLIIEEFLFFLLASTLTLHYFFWDHLWGHKRLHIVLGAFLTPFFLLQFYFINGIGSFMLTPGFQEGQVDLARGIVGWDMRAFYNPSFLMLTLHRALANFSYGAFAAAGLCGIRLYGNPSDRTRKYYEDGGRLAFYVGFAAFLSLPIVGYFYAHVLRDHANQAFVNLMWGKGDVVAGGVDWWWVKHVCVATMLGMTLSYYNHTRSREDNPFSLPPVLVVAVTGFYLMFYVAMGMIMTWKFFGWMLAVAVGGALLARHLLSHHGASPRGVFTLIGLLALATVILGGYARESSRPRFQGRISAHDDVYVPTQRAPYLMVDVDPSQIPAAPAPEEVDPAVKLIRQKCSGCHTLERVKNYPLDNWETIVDQMRAYGLRLSADQTRTIVEHLAAGRPF